MVFDKYQRRTAEVRGIIIRKAKKALSRRAPEICMYCKFLSKRTSETTHVYFCTSDPNRWLKTLPGSHCHWGLSRWEPR